MSSHLTSAGGISSFAISLASKRTPRGILLRFCSSFSSTPVSDLIFVFSLASDRVGVPVLKTFPANVFMKKVVEDLVESEELAIHSRYHTAAYRYPTGDFRFVLISEFLSNENELPWFEQLMMGIYLSVKGMVSSPKNWFGLDSDSVEIEKAPLLLKPVKDVRLKRVQGI